MRFWPPVFAALLAAVGCAAHPVAPPAPTPAASTPAAVTRQASTTAAAGDTSRPGTPRSPPSGGAASPLTVAPVPAPGAETTRYVLVRPGAFFHTAPPPAGQRAREASAAPPAAGGPQAATRFRLLHLAGDWVEVETIASERHDDVHCQRPSALFEGLAVRLFVASADLQPLTRRPVHAIFDAGAIELQAGVPIAQQGDGWTAFADGNTVPVELAADAVGTAYAPGPARAIAAQQTVLSPQVPLEIGGVRLALQGRRSDAAIDASSGRDGQHAVYVQHAAPESAGRVRVEVRTACAAYLATVAASALQKAQPPAVEAPRAEPPGRARFSARAGALIVSEEDQPLGRVVVTVPIADDANPDRQRPCFDWPLGRRGAAPDSALRFCIAAANLVESPAFLSDQQVAVITPKTRRQIALRIENHTQRPDAEIDIATRTAARRRLFALGDLVLVPPGEDEAMSASRATRNGLGRYTVKVSLDETLGAPGEMSSRRIETALVRSNGVADGRLIKAGQLQEFQSSRSGAEEADALEAMLDDAMVAIAEALRQQD